MIQKLNHSYGIDFKSYGTDFKKRVIFSSLSCIALGLEQAL